MSNKNDEFNFEEYAVKTIRYIDSIRSFLSFGDVQEVKNGASTKLRESRINAFYRAVGLPAAIPRAEENDTQREESVKFTRPDKYNNGNLHSSIDFDKDLTTSLDNRQLLYSTDATDDEINNFLDLNSQSVNSSIVEKNTNTERSRKRGLLFPMIVDGRIHVKPQRKRVAGAFMTDKQRQSKSDKNILYHKPLLEMIIDMRLKGENTVNSEEQSAITDDFSSDAIQELRNRGITSLDTLDEDGLKKIDKTLNTIAPVLERTALLLGKARSKTGTVVVPTVGGIAEQNPLTRLDEGKAGSLDIAKAAQDDREQLKSVILSIFKYDGSDKRNLDGGGMTSALIEMLVPKEKSVYENQKKSTEQQLEKLKLDIKMAYRSLELLLGTFSGISGVDILVVISALYKIDVSYLIALLNREAQERLAAVKGAELDALKSAKNYTVDQAIQQLEDKVRKIFNNIVESIKISKLDDKKHNQSGLDATEDKPKES